MRLNTQQRQHTRERIRAAIDQLLSGDIPPGGHCDVKTLARLSDVSRAAFYGTRPYTYLRQEFEQRLAVRRQEGDHPDRREAEITRLNAGIDALQRRLARSEQQVADLTEFQGQALSRLAAQHEELTRLRRDLERASGVRRLPAATP